MKELKQMFIEINDIRKEDPKKFYSSIIFAIMMFAGFYATMWIGAICVGRV
jgi:hypothetical protein